MDFSLNGGVLIVGSLLWDIDKQRISWRNGCLKIQTKIAVPAPIRYGRISNRKCTYTMVLSNECNEPALQGEGMFVPFSNNPINLDKIKIQSQELIKAERKKIHLKMKIIIGNGVHWQFVLTLQF